MDDYILALKAGFLLDVPVDLQGRILRGSKPEDFLTLSDDPKREVVMVMGSDGLQTLLGKSGYEMLVAIGYERAFIAAKIQQGQSFKLIVFEDRGVLPATWDNVARVVMMLYPETRPAFFQYLDVLKTTPFAAWQNRAGFNFLEVHLRGPKDPRYMTHDRFWRSSQTALDLRRFLYHTVSLSDLFAGDGFTRTYTGEKGLREYLLVNQPLVRLGRYRLVDLDVRLPK